MNVHKHLPSANGLRRRAMGWVVLVLLMMLALPQTALAYSIHIPVLSTGPSADLVGQTLPDPNPPTTVYDNWQSGNAASECAQVGTYQYAYKVDAAAPNGSWTSNGNTITILNSNGKVFDWNATQAISAVIVKAATGANVWLYSPPVNHDEDLYAYQKRDVSHVTFCWNPPLPKGTLIVKKVTDPAEVAGSFAFTLTTKSGAAVSGGTFSLAHGGTKSFELDPGEYKVEELVPANWTLTDVKCKEVTASAASVDEVDTVGPSNPKTVEVKKNKTYECVFTNKPKKLDLKIVKETLPDSGERVGWTMTVTNTDTGQKVASGPTDNNGVFFKGNLPFGTYQVCETLEGKAGWEVVGTLCRTVKLDSGSTNPTVVTFVNRRLGTLIVKKVTDPAEVEGSFDFTVKAAGETIPDGAFSLGHGGEKKFENITPGTYAVEELVPANWTLKSVECTNTTSIAAAVAVPQNPASVTIGSGETWTCVFTNEPWRDLRVIKRQDSRQGVALSGWSITVTNTETGQVYEPISTNGDKTNGEDGLLFEGLPFGEYLICETMQPGWEAVEEPCKTVKLDADSDIPTTVVTFVNRRLGNLIVRKETVPAGMEDTFAFTVTERSGAPVGFKLGDGDEKKFENITPGVYGVVEATPAAGWSLTGIKCVLADADEEGNPQQNSALVNIQQNSALVNIDSGETWICVFTNTFQPQIYIEKATNGIDADEAKGPYITVGDAVTWTYVVTSTGAVTDVVVTDDQGVTPVYVDGDTNGNQILEPGETWIYEAYGTAQELGQYRNVGAVTAMPIGPNGDLYGQPVNDDDPSHYFGSNPGIKLEKYTNGHDADTPTGPYVKPTDPIVWTYVVSNTGNITLTNVKVTDDKIGDITCPKDILAPLEEMECTANGTAGAGQYVNLGTVTAVPEDAEEGDEPIGHSDPSHYFGVAPAIELQKLTNGEDADDPTGPYVMAGDLVTWTYVVKNTGNVTLTNVTVDDDKVGPICVIDVLAPNAQQSCEKSGIAVLGQYVNMGFVTGTTPVGMVTPPISVSDDDPSHYFGANPSISLEKFTNGVNADEKEEAPELQVGDPVTWTYVVSNTGNVTLINIQVTDDKEGFICNIPSLAPQEEWTCQKTGVAVLGEYSNIGTAVGQPVDDNGQPFDEPVGTPVEDTDPSHYVVEDPTDPTNEKTVEQPNAILSNKLHLPAIGR